MKTIPLAWRVPALVLLAFVTAAFNNAHAVPVLATDNLADLINNATAGTRFTLDGNTIYTLTEDVFIKKGKNSPIFIQGPGGEDNLPNNTQIVLGPFRIEMEQDTGLNLTNLGIVGGLSTSIIVPVGATLGCSRVFFTQGNLSVRLLGNGNFASCVFASSNRGIQQDGGVANIVQCTFIDTIGVTSNNGRLNLMANLFKSLGDAPVLAATNGTNGYWYANLVGTDNTVPSTFAGASQPAPIVTTPTIEYDTAAWPGKLNEATQAPLYAGNLTATGPTAVLDSVSALRTDDFEGDIRLAQIQIGADELNSGQRVGWLSGEIVTRARRSDDLAVAAGGEVVTIEVEVRGINLSGAELLIVPELGNETSPTAFERVPITQRSTGFGRATYNTPSEACSANGQMFDGRANIVIRTSNGTILRGQDSDLQFAEYQFVIDTTDPVLGAINNTLIEGSFLGDIIISNDVTLAASTISVFPDAWAPGNVAKPSNYSTLGKADNSPQVFFGLPYSSPYDLEFTLPMQFVDSPASPCEGSNVSPTEVAGFEFPAFAPTTINEAFNPNPPPGRAVLLGSVPGALAAANPFSATATFPVATATDVLDVTWSFNDLTYEPRWRADLTPAVTDIAGNGYNHPRPLEFWWLAEAELTAEYVYLQEPLDPEEPSFAWSIRRPGRPNEDLATPSNSLVSCRLWRADDPNNTQGSYTRVTGWSDYTRADEIDATTFFPDQDKTLGEILALPNNDNGYMMLTILVADNAGNLQESLISALPSANFPRSKEVFLNNIASELELEAEGLVAYVTWGNSEDRTDTVDTRMRAKLFWNRVDSAGNQSDDNGDIRRVEADIDGERDFGSSTRIPLPPEDDCAQVFTRVEGQFFITAEGTEATDTRRVAWELLEEGRVVATGILCTTRESGYRGVVQIPEDLQNGGITASTALDRYGYEFEIFLTRIPEPLQTSKCAVQIIGDRLGDEGDPNQNKRRRSIKYLFRAATIVESLANPDCNDGFTLEEETPATFQFTVTPADEFDSGEQPVKIFAPL